MVYHEQKEQDWREQAAALQKRLDYYEQENARLQLQNEALHETAWQLIRLKEKNKKTILKIIVKTATFCEK